MNSQLTNRGILTPSVLLLPHITYSFASIVPSLISSFTYIASHSCCFLFFQFRTIDLLGTGSRVDGNNSALYNVENYNRILLRITLEIWSNRLYRAAVNSLTTRKRMLAMWNRLSANSIYHGQAVLAPYRQTLVIRTKVFCIYMGTLSPHYSYNEKRNVIRNELEQAALEQSNCRSRQNEAC